MGTSQHRGPINRILEEQVCGAEEENRDAAPASAEDGKKRIVYFVRHGQSTANVAGHVARAMPGMVLLHSNSFY